MTAYWSIAFWRDMEKRPECHHQLYVENAITFNSLNNPDKLPVQVMLFNSECNRYVFYFTRPNPLVPEV